MSFVNLTKYQKYSFFDEMFLYVFAGLVAILLISYFFWHLAKFWWLDKICGFIVISLPFERIPSLGLGSFNVRISQILVILGVWVFLILLLKKDKDLSNIQLNRLSYFIPLFFIFSIPSWLFVLDSNRFFSTIAATLISFGALFLLSNFTQNIFQKLKHLVAVLVFVCVFGLYQFFGDLVGIPYSLTGLRIQYTKIVFGIPRVQGTAIEPLYFAGMLFLPIFFTIFLILSGRKEKIVSFKDINIKPYFLFIFFTLLFALTISKGAIICLLFTGCIAVSLTYGRFRHTSFIKYLKKLAFISVSIISFLYLFFEKVATIIQGLIANFIASVTFQFASSVERLDFVKAALVILPQNILFGVGSGQYGVWARNLVNVPTTLDSYLIVNNVYLEVWLEYGFFSFVIFLFLLFTPLIINFKKLYKHEDWNTEVNLSRLIIGFSLVTYYIQWLTFSPIFIMPIFILLGLFTKLSDLE